MMNECIYLYVYMNWGDLWSLDRWNYSYISIHAHVALCMGLGGIQWAWHLYSLYIQSQWCGGRGGVGGVFPSPSEIVIHLKIRHHEVVCLCCFAFSLLSFDRFEVLGWSGRILDLSNYYFAECILGKMFLLIDLAVLFN